MAQVPRPKGYFACLVGSLLSVLGCSASSHGELRELQTQNRVLSEQNRVQQSEIANLREHQRKLEDRLIRADRNPTANLR